MNKHIRSYKLILLGIIICIMPNILLAQYQSINTISSELVKIEKGLSQNSVRCILKDRQGFLWFGTWDGLNRYDGIEFRILSYNPDNPKSELSSQTVNCILQDDNDNIWVGTLGGIDKIDPKTLQVTHINEEHGLVGDTILSMYLQDNKYIWAGTSRGIQILNIETHEVNALSSLYTLPELRNKEIRSIHAQNEDVLWIGTNNGLFRLNLRSGQLRNYPADSLNGISNKHITSVESYKDSLIFVGTESGFNIINWHTQEISRFYSTNDNLGNDAILSLMVDHKKKLWIGTSGGGVSILDITKGDLELLKVQFNDAHKLKVSLDQQYIHSLYEDDKEVVWIGTAWNGVVQLNTRAQLFKHFRKFAPSASKKVYNKNIWTLIDSGNEIWMGTDGGIHIYNKKTHQFTHLNKQNGLKTNRIRALYKDTRGIIWIGTFQGGLHAYNPNTKKFTYYSVNSETHQISDNTIWNICEDKQHNLWVGTYNGLTKINLLTHQSEIYKQTTDEHSLSNNKVYSVFEDKSNNIWIGTYDGLNLYRPETNDFEIFKHIKGDTNSLSTNRIFNMYQDTFNNLWIGTMGGGLNRFNLKTKEVKFFTKKDGLSNNVVYNILADNQGGLWMSTNSGINYINLFDEQIRSYDLKDGLQGLEFNLGAALKDSEGNLYFGGTNGFNVFNPEAINEIYNSPITSITSIQVMGEEILCYLQHDDTLEFDYDDNSFTISFAALDFQNPDQNQYRYKLQNYDEQWVMATPNENKVSYNRVKPGNYVFQLYAAGFDKKWDALPLKVTIIINPPWYQTWVFRILFVIGMAVSIYVAVSLRITRLKNKHQIQQKLLELERQSLRLQMNPHFIFNTLNSIQSFVLNNEQDDSIQYLSKFSKLMRMMLSASRENVIIVEDEIKLLTYYLELERLRFDKSFNFEFDIDEEIDQEFIEIPPMLLQPYIENAIIHGLQGKEDGLLTIRMKLDGDFINISIQDNGIGRVASQKKKRVSGLKHKSKGMLITKERLELLNQDVEQAYSVRIIDNYDSAGKPTGTCVELLVRYEEH